MIILGLDQAPKGTGFAYGEPGSVPTFGYQHFPDFGSNTARLRAYVRDWIVQAVQVVGIHRIYYEQIVIREHAMNLPVIHKQFAVMGGIETGAEMAGLVDDCYETFIADWRREFYGGARPKGGSTLAWKLMAPIECAKRGWLTDDHNIAEALGIWHYGCLCADHRYRVNAGIHTRRAQLQREREAR